MVSFREGRREDREAEEEKRRQEAKEMKGKKKDEFKGKEVSSERRRKESECLPSQHCNSRDRLAPDSRRLHLTATMSDLYIIIGSL